MVLLLLLRHIIKATIETQTMMQYYSYTVTSMHSMTMTLWG